MSLSDREYFNKILKTENTYFSTFASLIEKKWGAFFINLDWKDRYDANHASIIDLQGDYDEIIDEVIDFYRSNSLCPRIYFYSGDKNHPFKAALSARGFSSVEEFSSKSYTFMTFRITSSKLNEFLVPKNVQVFSENNVDDYCDFGDDIQKLFIQKDVPSGVFSRVLKHPNNYYFLLYLNNKPVAMSLFHLNHEEKMAAIEDVLTLPEFRRRGFGTYLVSFGVSWAVKNRFDVYLTVIAENAHRIYSKIGFKDFLICYDYSWYLQ